MIDDLISFKAVIEAGSITAATKKLNITQPALSKKIQKLEKLIGSELLIRTKKGVRPTKAGKMVYDSALKISANWSSLNRKIEYAKHKTLTIRLGMIDNIALSLKNDFYRKITDKFEKIDLQVKIHNSTRLIEGVANGFLDLAIITRPEKLSNTINYSFFHKEEFEIVGNSATMKLINSVKDLEAVPFASYDEQSNTHTYINSVFKQSRLNINFKILSSSPEFILKMITYNKYLAVLPTNLIKDSIRAGKLVAMSNHMLSFTRELMLIHKKDNSVTKEIAYFINEIQSSI